MSDHVAEKLELKRTLHAIGCDLRSLSDRIKNWRGCGWRLGSVTLTANMTTELARLCLTMPFDLEERFRGFSGALAKVVLDGCPLENTSLADDLWNLLDEIDAKF